MSATEALVRQILRTVDGQTRGLNMRVASVRKSVTSVYDVCLVGQRVVFHIAEDGTDLGRVENKEGDKQLSRCVLAGSWR